MPHLLEPKRLLSLMCHYPTQPGVRIPITAQPKPFVKAVELGRRVIWLHTLGE